MSTIAIRVDDKLKEEATAVYKELGLDMTTAVKLFLRQSVLTRSIPFDLKLDNDLAFDTESGDYIRTRDLTEYNVETQASYLEYMKKYQEKGIEPSSESVEDFFVRMVKEAVRKIVNQEDLGYEYKKHILEPKRRIPKLWEIHIGGRNSDLLMIFYYLEKGAHVVFDRLGTHSDLF